MSIKDNINQVKNSIAKISNKYNRLDGDVELLAVSKTKPVEMLVEAYEAGQRLFGENRVSEAEVKVPLMPNDAKFHMIGHLQSNKAYKACTLFSCIQSVDSLKIAKKIDSACKTINKVMDIYLDINIVNDVNKTGFIIGESFYQDLEELVKLENINIIGLMCIGAHVDDKNIIKKSFRDLNELSKNLGGKYRIFKNCKLSMGMSGDYEEAIAEGSTMVRVGSNIFGTRNL